MTNPNPKNQFKKGEKKTIEAGQKSKRIPLDVKMYADIQKEVQSKNRDGTASKKLITIEDAMRSRLIKASLNEDNFLPYMKEIFDRTYGTSTHKYEETNTSDNPAELTEEQKKKLEENYGDDLKKAKRPRVNKAKRTK